MNAPIELMTIQASQILFSQSQAASVLCWLLDILAPITATALISPASIVLMPAMLLYTVRMMLSATTKMSSPAANAVMEKSEMKRTVKMHTDNTLFLFKGLPPF